MIEIIGRSEWAGSLEPVGPLEAESPGDVRFLLVHHTVASNDYLSQDVPAILRSYFNYHTSAEKGWNDVAYNFCVDRFGRIWETRKGSIAAPIKGDATGGSQGFALLCAFIGDHSNQDPSEDAIAAMGSLLGFLGQTYGLDLSPGATTSFVSRGSNRHAAGSNVNAATVSPHRAMSLTSCPGDAGVRLITERLIPIASGSDSLAPVVSTTVSPTTVPPTTVPPTTLPPTTVPPTTVPPTTLPPTTVSPTTVSPTTGPPTAADTSGLTASAVSSAQISLQVPGPSVSGPPEAASAEFLSSANGRGLAEPSVYGPIGLIAVGLAGLIALRRRDPSPD